MDAIVQLHTGLKEVNKRYDECQSIICEQNNLTDSAIHHVISGKRNHHKGWKRPVSKNPY